MSERISATVARMLRQIAKNGPPSNWPGFDDADIKWLLTDNADKVGPALDELRGEYALFRRDMKLNYLYFFPVTQEQAAALVRELRRRPRKK